MDTPIHYSDSSAELIHAASVDDFGIGSIERFKETDLLALVEDADRQREYMLPWDHDQKLTKEGWTTVYAIDADIFRFYSAPEDIARQQASRLGYAEVFRRDSDAGVRILAYRLADYIFFHLQPRCPLIVLPPIDEEVRRIIVALTMELGQEPVLPPIDVEAVNRLLEPLKRLLPDATIPEDKLLQLNRMLGPRGLAQRQTHYLRLTYLLELRKVVASHSIAASDNYPAPVFEISSALQTDGVSEYAELLDAWMKRFGKGESRPPVTRRNSAWQYDASALARLELWNNHLAKHKCRLLYITGSAHVLAATASYPIENSSFRSKYIRHPKYFLASPDVIASTERDIGTDGVMRSQFVEWVRTFLADFEEGRGSGDASSSQTETVKRAFARVSSLGETLMIRWRKHMRSLSVAYQAPDPVQRLFQDDINDKRSLQPFTEWSDVLALLERRIESMTDEAWEACFRSATTVGFFVSSANAIGSSGLPSRLVPPLRFDSWRKTDAFVNRMAQWRNADDINQDDYNSALDEMRYETKEDYKYAYYLAHAALFAARGNWGIGAVLCKRALDQVKGVQPKQGSLGHGREARYLAAHCIRHTARSVRDLDEAERLLTAAEETYKEETSWRPNLSVLPERFEVERLATKLTRYLFGLFRSGNQIQREMIISSAQRDGVVIGMRDELVAIHQKLTEEMKLYVDGLNSASIRSCLKHELTRIDANVFFISILLGEMHGSLASHAGQRLFNRSGRGSFYQDVLGRIWDVTRRNSTASSVEFDRLKRDLSEAAEGRNIVLAYDGQRYRFLVEVLERETRAELERGAQSSADAADQ